MQRRTSGRSYTTSARATPQPTPSGKCDPLFSQKPGRIFPSARKTTLVQGGQVYMHQHGANKPDPLAPRSVPNCRQKRNVPICRLPAATTPQVEKKSAKTRQSEQGAFVPNDYHGYADVSAMPASGRQSEQIGMKRGRHRPSGHAVLFE